MGKSRRGGSRAINEMTWFLQQIRCEEESETDGEREAKRDPRDNLADFNTQTSLPS